MSNFNSTFNFGDTVYWMDWFKVQTGVVKGISMFKSSFDTPIGESYLVAEAGHEQAGSFRSFRLEQLYRTYQEAHDALVKKMREKKSASIRRLDEEKDKLENRLQEIQKEREELVKEVKDD